MTEPPAGPRKPIDERRDLDRAPAQPTDDGRGFILDPRISAETHPAPLAPTRAATVRGSTGRDHPAEFRHTSSGDVEVRYPVAVIETKVPYAQRPTRGLLDTDAQCAERGYQALWQPLHEGDQLGAPDAPDNDPRHGVGVQSWWTAWFTEDEQAALAAADNVTSATWQTVHAPIGFPRRLA